MGLLDRLRARDPLSSQIETYRPRKIEALPTPEHRAVIYDVTDTSSGAHNVYTVFGPPDLAPSWAPGEYGGALGIPGVFRAVDLISGVLGETPLHAWRSLAGERPVRLDPDPPILGDPCPPDTPASAMSALGMDYLMHGNGIALFTSWSREGHPTSYVPVPAEYVSVATVTDPELSDFYQVPTGTRVYDIAGEKYPSSAVLHVKRMARPGQLRGLGVLEARLTLETAREQTQQASQIAQGAVPTGILQATNPDYPKSEYVKDKAAWVASQRSRTVAMLSPNLTFTPIAWNPEEMQMVEARKFSLQEIALLFGLPGRYLGVEAGSLTYSSPSLDSIDLLKWTLSQHFVRFEQEFSRHMPRTTRARFNRDAVLATDTITRYNAYNLASGGAAWLTVPEIRDAEDLGPLEEAAPGTDPDADEATGPEPTIGAAETSETTGQSEGQSDD